MSSFCFSLFSLYHPFIFLATLNLENKPRINVLLDYLNIANVSYFKPKTTMLIGSFFYSSRIDNEIDGAILCNGYK